MQITHTGLLKPNCMGLRTFSFAFGSFYPASNSDHFAITAAAEPPQHFRPHVCLRQILFPDILGHFQSEKFMQTGHDHAGCGRYQESARGYWFLSDHKSGN